MRRGPGVLRRRCAAVSVRGLPACSCADVRRRPVRLVLLLGGVQAVAHVAHRPDEVVVLGAQLGAQTTDVDVYRA